MQTNYTIEQVRALAANVQSVDPSGETYPKICAFLDKMDDETLKGLAGAQIKWFSALAINRCVRRGII